MARFRLLFLCVWLGGFGATFLLGPFAAAADDEAEPDYARSGPYIRGAGQLALSTSRQGFGVPLQQSWQPDFGLDVALGWRESERVAVELEFEWITSNEGAGFGSWLIGANGKFYFLEERIQPYLVLGASGMWTKVPGARESRVGWAFRNGLGVDFYLTENWALTGESTFVWGVGELWKNYYLTFGLGAMYRF